MAGFETEYKRLNSQQREAVDNIDGPMLVIAGPGTGKTQLLSMRVANILKKTDVQPYNILCLTYTESGKKAMINRLENFLGKIGKNVEVHTFHGFGTRLINRFPHFFPELAKFRPAEDLTLYETLRACLQSLPRSNPLSKQAYGQFTYQPDARDRISQLKRAGISPETTLKKAQSDLEWSKSVGRQIAKIFEDAGRLSPKSANSLLPKIAELKIQTENSDLGQLCLEELHDALQGFETTSKTALISAFKKKWLASEEGKLYFKPIDQMKKLLALAELYQKYEAELKKRGLYDYDDMILFALEKLRHNKEFLSQVQETFQFILADEYQDTNAAQASIINLIADNPVNEGRPNVMVVGDDDQAIYGFQGALGDVLMDFRERWRDVKVITLKSNYRSTSSVLSTARSIISQGQNRLENRYEDVDKTLTPQVSYPDVTPTIFESTSPEAVIHKAVSAAKSNDTDKQLAIIATKHKYLLELADRLDEAKVDYYYEGREDLLKDSGITSLLLIANCVLAIKQKAYSSTSYLLPEIIANANLEVPRITAWEIALQSKQKNMSWWEVMLKSKDSDVKIAVKVLKDLSKSINAGDSLTSLNTIAKDCRLRVLQKVRRLQSHAKTYYDRENISLNELLRYTILCQQAGVTLEHKVIKGNQFAPVVLLSAHKSKGLEFDKVYILHADYRTWFKESGRRNNLVLPPNWNSIEPSATSSDDRLRLLYVVMTRAKQQLALLKDQHSQSIPGLEDLRTEQYVSEQIQAFALPEETNWQSWYAPKTHKETIALKNLLAPTMKTYHLSPTHMTMYLDVAHGGPQTFFTRIILGIPEPVHPEAVFGSYVHKTLNYAQNQLNKTGKIPTPKQLEVYIKELITTDELLSIDIVKVVSEFLEHNQVIQIGGVSEYNFSNQTIKLDNKLLTGTVDHFVLNDDELFITDYKTGRALNSWAIKEDYYKQKLHRFRQQLMFYELLFTLSAEFDFKNIHSKVSFVEPSRRDIYCQLELDASPAERQKFDAILHAVWKYIVELKFPDTSEYSADMDGITNFEEFLLSNSEN